MSVERHNVEHVGAALAVIGSLWLAASCAAAWGGTASAEPDMLAVLADMAVQAHQFKAEKLHALGVAGLSALLDELLPDTAGPKKLRVAASAVAQMIERLGSNSSRVRETATAELLEVGPAAAPWLSAAARSGDAEVRWRATYILRSWEARKWDDKSIYLPAFAVYASGIRDEARLKELLRRTVLAFDAGLPDGGRCAILGVCVRAIVASGDDRYTDQLQPLLKHGDVQVAVLVTASVGEATGSLPQGRYFPRLLLDALRADREEVVSAAIGWAENCGDSSRRAEIERLLIAIFQGTNEQLKFQVCSPLMHRHHYAPARDYLLQQAQSTDLNHRYMALSWLCNPRQPGAAPDEKTLKTLGELLESKDAHTRYMAVCALSTYTGEEVVKRLIDMLADANQIIPNELRNRLRQQPDKAMLRRLLAQAAKNHDKEKVRQQAAALLRDLEERQ